MVFKSVKRIKAALPEVQHIVMFYNNGIIYQSTFEPHVNIPKLGENLADLIAHMHSIYELSNFPSEGYNLRG